MQFDSKSVEAKWRKYWQENETYKVNNKSDKPKYYILDMFPYPSGAGLHVGHPLGYIASDIVARYKKLKGFNVLHPMGFDTFGLPAEQYAIQTGQHPADSTVKNIKTYKNQMDLVGFCYDWSREVQTCDPKYYKWTQWIFTELFNHFYNTTTQKATPIAELISHFEANGTTELAAWSDTEHSFTAEEWTTYAHKEQQAILMDFRLTFQKESTVNWCEELGTVLANDEVKEGKSERGGFPVIKKPMTQWFLRITAYAERLINGMENLDWSESMKEMQRNWIGKSEGASVFFQLAKHQQQLEVFTTRPDTIFGATFMVIAPEHDLVKQITTSAQTQAIEDYIDYVQSRSELERVSEVKTVTGAFTGAYAIHPFTGKEIPVWISEYVLASYGTGAIMAVPSDDERDHAFATKFDLPIIEVVDKENAKDAKDGIMINSDFLNGLKVKKAIKQAIYHIDSKGFGSKKVNYRLRDAGFSRQRYWGEPFPIIYKDGIAEALPIEQLPLELPIQNDFKPTGSGEAPLAKNTAWVKEVEGYEREVDTMPGYAGSSWYFLRYMDVNNDDALVGKEAIDYWQDVDLYIGGAEHAVGHLLYSRFWHKFLFDKGITITEEPYKKLVNQGMIQGRSLVTKAENISSQPAGVHIPINLCKNDRIYKDKFIELQSIDNRFESINIETDVNWETEEGRQFISLQPEVEKMSKSKFNVVNPDDVINQYGADCFRMYEMFLGPIEQAKPWNTKGLEGVSKFLKKYWSLFANEEAVLITNDKPTKPALKILHQTINKVENDIEKLSFNTAISAFMICVNELKSIKCHSKEILEPLTVLMAPFAPFITAEAWNLLGNDSSIFEQNQTITYPKYEASFTVESDKEYPVMINGKMRAKVVFPLTKPKEEIEKEVLELEQVLKYTEGNPPKRIIVVPNKIINIVV